MALPIDDISENVRQGKSDESCVRRTRQIPRQMLLFEEEKRKRVDASRVVKTAVSQIDILELNSSSSVKTQRDELFVIVSPRSSKRSTPVPPNAPIKPKILFSKVGLRPKKLHFLDKERNGKAELNESCPNYSMRSISNEPGPSRESKHWTRENLGKSRPRERSSRRYLNSMLENMRLDATANNKENRRLKSNEKDRYDGRPAHVRPIIVEERAKSASAKSNGKTHYKSQDLTKCPSTCGDNLSTEKILSWLQPRRDIGMMIQCCHKNCKKWRYCDDYHDPVDVPLKWYCEMNSDKSIASCLLPKLKISEEFQEDLIENKYNAGSIVWARINGYPWWPAIVDDCPEALRYYELQEPSIIPVKYHVTFFDESYVRHAWVNCNKITALIKADMQKLVRKTVFYGVDYKERVETAYALAQKAISLTILRRLQMFSSHSRLSNTQKDEDASPSVNDVTNQDDDSDDEVIPPTPPGNHITLKEMYNILKNKSSNTF